MSAEVDVSVIVPVWNNGRQLQACLEALQAQDFPQARFEIIVADNGSSDDTVSVARQFSRVNVVVEPRSGSYIARNTALRTAIGRYVAFTDSDCIPHSDWLSTAFTRAVSDPAIGLVAGPIELFDEEAGRAVCRDYEKLFSFPQDPSAGNCATANWMSPRHVLEEVGGFSEIMKSGADKEMALRIRQAGYLLVLANDMIVEHPVRATYKALVAKRRRLTGGRWDRMHGAGRMRRALRLQAVETYRRLQRILAYEQFSTSQRAKLMALWVYMSGVSVAEYMRLGVGGQPVR